MTVNQLIDELSNYHGNAGVQLVFKDTFGRNASFAIKRVSTLPNRNIIFITRGPIRETVSAHELKLLNKPKQPGT